MAWYLALKYLSKIKKEIKDKWSKHGKILVIMSLDDNMWVHCTFLHIFEVFILEKESQVQ